MVVNVFLFNNLFIENLELWLGKMGRININWDLKKKIEKRKEKIVVNIFLFNNLFIGNWNYDWEELKYLLL